MLRAELGRLSDEPYEQQRRRIIKIASALEDQGNIPVIAEQMALINDIQTDEWWADVSYPMLEEARKRLRSLVHLIERTQKNILYTDFADQLGASSEVDLPGTGGSVAGNEFEQFYKKARRFLHEHLADDIVAKVRSGAPITAADIDELQRVLVAAGIGDTDTFAQASKRAGSFGLFIRSIVGLDRTAAKRAFAKFLDDKRYTRNQIEFVNLVINYLTEYGSIHPARIYESPFTTVAPQGPETIFENPDLDEFFTIVKHLHDTAAA